MLIPADLDVYWQEGIKERLELLSLKPKTAVTITESSLNTLDAKEAFDLIRFEPFLQNIDDVPGILKATMKALKPSGFFIAPYFGQDSLWELRESLAHTDYKHFSGVYQRLIPMIHVNDAAMLMQQTGFKDATVDVDHFTFYVKDTTQLLKKIRRISSLKEDKFQSNDAKPTTLKHTCNKAYFQDLEEHYSKNHSRITSEQLASQLSVSLDIVYLCGWGKGKPY